MEVDFESDDIMTTSGSVMEMTKASNISINALENDEEIRDELHPPEDLAAYVELKKSWDPHCNSMINGPNGRFTEAEATEDMDPYMLFKQN